MDATILAVIVVGIFLVLGAYVVLKREGRWIDVSGPGIGARMSSDRAPRRNTIVATRRSRARVNKQVIGPDGGENKIRADESEVTKNHQQT